MLFGVTDADGLPQRIEYLHDGTIGRLAGASVARPPSVAWLRRKGLVAPPTDPSRYFDDGGKAVSAWLSRFGLRSLSVRDGVIPDVMTPDGILVGPQMTWEAKLPASVSGLMRAFEDARHQSARLIVWARSGVSSWQAIEVLRRRLPSWGADYREIVIVLGEGGGAYVHWWRG